MTEAELDVAGADVYDCVKAFLSYCTDGSMDAATRNAMDYVKTKYTMNNVEYRKLCDSARAAYCDITKKPLSLSRPSRPYQQNNRRHQGNKR